MAKNLQFCCFTASEPLFLSSCHKSSLVQGVTLVEVSSVANNVSRTESIPFHCHFGICFREE